MNKNQMIAEIVAELYQADNGTVNVLYRIICKKREKQSLWRKITKKGLKVQSKGQI